MDQGYTIKAASEAVGVGKSTLEYWIRQLREERRGKTPTSLALTPEQRQIQVLEKGQLQQVASFCTITAWYRPWKTWPTRRWRRLKRCV